MSWPIPCEPAALEPVRRRLGRWLAAAGWPDEAVADVVLAVNEAVSNAVEHGCAQRCDGVRLDARVSTVAGRRRVDCTVHDCGDWDGVARRCATRGFGLPMIRELSDEVRIEHGGAGTTIHLTSLDPPG
ncbi:ATP-binding protein [Pseudonocardia sulfidoxydans]|uniref:ATP-binding protein n=1 Tax=Pseudonocardia sulfidoxydans TaxID=54011 RepID=UPI0036189986